MKSYQKIFLVFTLTLIITNLFAQSTEKEKSGAQNLWLSPTAFNLPKGTSKYRVIDIVNHSFEYGITDNISVVGGLNGLPYVEGYFGYLFTSLRVKGTFSLSEFAHFGLSLGATNGIVKNENDYRAVLPSVILTLGKPENFLNLSYGYIFERTIAEYGNDNDSKHLVSIGWSIKFSQYWSLVSDNVIVIEEGYDMDYLNYLPSLGFKRNKGKNQFDFGLYYPFEEFSSDSFPIPIIGYTRFF